LGVETFENTAQCCVASIPVAKLVNPLTGLPTTAPAAMLVDHVGGVVNHNRRGQGQWTVTTELSLELTADAEAIIDADPATPLFATAVPITAKNAAPLAECTLTIGGEFLARATVRSVYIDAPDDHPWEWIDAGDPAELAPTLAERMALRAGSDPNAPVLYQTPDSALNNTMSIVHGGISAAALELVASAAINHDPNGIPLKTASLHVNYLRPFRAGPRSRYEGTILRVGRGSGVGEACAIDDDGAVALTARLTAYR
jgi:uncharacterized protein (TIGR00369 family)